ncbi:MAG: hypothetical protein NZ932_04255 [Candidatus Bathyarchaeota archaeon]|nr:hypothetical protein [Candidatus Bathyarchaeota archaeon]MDW8040468.1 hypothetical protein [Nitrososphaerota archaeon]
MSTKLEKLLMLLNDNQWHSINQVAETLEIPPEKAQKIVEILTEADMIQHNSATNQVKLNQNWKTLIINQRETPSEQEPTPATAIATIIIPPQKTLTIQQTRITNLTDTSLELEIRINKKLNEIAINKIN